MRKPDATESAAGWIVPDWPAAPGVRALCTTRAGGVSTGACESLNLGDHVGDDPQAVAANRARLAQAIGVRPVFLRQVHGTGLLALEADTPDGLAADASTTTVSGLACAVMVADCLPVLLVDRAGVRVAAAHAGWRGLAAGVLARSCEAFAAQGGANALIAWMGPCIGPRAFEVGEDVRMAFVTPDPGAARCFVPAPASGKWLADLPGLARRQLRALGVAGIYGNDGSDAWCTVRNPSRFFSFRRDGASGRFAALVWRD